MPLQLGVRDMAFRRSTRGLVADGIGHALTSISLAVGESPRRRDALPPLSELEFSPAWRDYYLWALQISGIGTLLSGINFVTTILKMRAPGMTLMSSRCSAGRRSPRI